MQMAHEKSREDTASLMAEIGRKARAAARPLAIASAERKNAALVAMADAIASRRGQDPRRQCARHEERRGSGPAAPSFIDRLTLDAEAHRATWPTAFAPSPRCTDPVGEVIAEWDRPNGLQIERVRTPLGVIGVIYESRPNVTADAGALCLKAGNAVILRGGSDSLHSSAAIHACLVEGLKAAGLPADAIQLVPTTDRAAVGEMLTGLTGNLDVIVPRGGKSLVARVQNEARVPVFAHLEGICHVYVDTSADLDMAEAIVVNAKMRRTGICGAAETLLVDRAVLRPRICVPLLEALRRGRLRDPRRRRGAAGLLRRASRATEADWATEYLDAIISVKLVDGIAGAIDHIETLCPRTTPRRSSPRTRRRSSASSTRSIRPSCCTMPRPSSPMAASSAWAPRSASPPARCMRAGRSASSS